MCPRSDEALIGTKDGLVRANTVKRKPIEQAFDAKEVLEINVGPSSASRRTMLGSEDDDDVGQEVIKMDKTEEAATAKRMRIVRSDFEEIGFTDGCPGCSAIQSEMPAKNHSEQCRRRVETHLNESHE